MKIKHLKEFLKRVGIVSGMVLVWSLFMLAALLTLGLSFALVAIGAGLWSILLFPLGVVTTVSLGILGTYLSDM